jgi:hypothetical protein
MGGGVHGPGASGVHGPGGAGAAGHGYAAGGSMAHHDHGMPGHAAPVHEAGIRGPEAHGLAHADRPFGGGGHEPMERHEEGLASAHGADMRHGAEMTRGPEMGRHEVAGFAHPPEHRDFGHERETIAMHGHDFHVRYVRDFSPYERARWRGGYWRSDWHYGRFGWWWNVGDGWYPYADPVFPYPVEVVQPAVYETQVVAEPDPEPAAAPAAVDRTIPLLPAPPPGRYSCASPAGYFPDVDSCNGPWQLAPDVPPPPQP